MRGSSIIKLALICLAMTFRTTDAQNILVNTSQNLPLSPAYNPGFFYNNTTTYANNIFNSSGFRCNVLRLGDLSYFIRISSNFQDAINRVRNFRSIVQLRAQYTDILVLELSGMPLWLSSSQNTSQTCSGWLYYQTVKPADYQPYDSLIRSISAEIATWGITSYFEVWNEPDIDCFWRGTEDEIIELYRHFANAVRQGNPNAKTGGIAVNGWHRKIGSAFQNSIAGYITDELAEASTMAGMINDCAINNTPLDFISFHYFTPLQGTVENSMTFFRNKLRNSGFPNCRIIVTEYNGPLAYRETTIHPPFVLMMYDEFVESDLFFHCIASLQDFSLNSVDEFFGDYGCISRNGIMKPVYYMKYLMNKVRRSGVRKQVDLENKMIGLAVQNYDTLRLIFANYVANPVYGGRNDLFYGSSRINTLDLINAGYVSWAQIDSTIAGQLTPFGPPEVIAAFHNANAYYDWAVGNYFAVDTVVIKFSGWSGTRNGSSVLIDDKENNNIYFYDSLIASGNTNQQAISHVLNNQIIFSRNENEITPSFTVRLKPNSLYYLEVFGAPLTGMPDINLSNKKYHRLSNYPNPFNPRTRIEFEIPESGNVSLLIYDLLGRECGAMLRNTYLSMGSHSFEFDAKNLASGVYYYSLVVDGNKIQTNRMVLLK